MSKRTPTFVAMAGCGLILVALLTIAVTYGFPVWIERWFPHEAVLWSALLLSIIGSVFAILGRRSLWGRVGIACEVLIVMTFVALMFAPVSAAPKIPPNVQRFFQGN